MDKKTQKFINKAILKHFDKYDYSKVQYVKTNEKVIIICKEHGEFIQTPNKHLSGRGCKKCWVSKLIIKRLSNTEEFIEKVKLIHGEKYDYSKVNYINSFEKVIIICKEHGEFIQTPKNHLECRGCKKCGILNKNIKRSSNTEEFIEKVKLIHGEKYDYSKVNYINGLEKVIIVCKIHGEFFQRPISHLHNKSECSKCSNKQFSKSQIQWLELLSKLNNIHIQHAMNDGEFKIPFTKYISDGYCKETNTIYEFHGDYWHGNPKTYNSNQINKTCNKTHGELYQKTIEKEKKIKELGYNLVIMWEFDWIKINKAIKYFQSKFKSLFN